MEGVNTGKISCCAREWLASLKLPIPGAKLPAQRCASRAQVCIVMSEIPLTNHYLTMSTPTATNSSLVSRSGAGRCVESWCTK